MGVLVRRVFESNLESEIFLIDSVLEHFPLVAFDTEFPGTVFETQKPFSTLTTPEKFSTMIKNVNNTKIIQLGLCLSDEEGNLPDFGSEHSYVWEFNFRGFDEEVDAQNPSSIQLLKDQGIDFQKNNMEGIDPCHFAHLFLNSGLGVYAMSIFGPPMSGIRSGFPTITWVMYHSLYDLGYLIKILTYEDLPDDQFQFIVLVYAYLGFSIFDVKEIISPLCLHGGLDKIARNLGVSREGGKSHQAGSDSLLTMKVFLRLRELCFNGEDSYLLKNYNHKLYGLEKADLSEVQQSLLEIRERTMYGFGQIEVESLPMDCPMMPGCPPYAIVRGPPVYSLEEDCEDCEEWHLAEQWLPVALPLYCDNIVF